MPTTTQTVSFSKGGITSALERRTFTHLRKGAGLWTPGPYCSSAPRCGRNSCYPFAPSLSTLSFHLWLNVCIANVIKRDKIVGKEISKSSIMIDALCALCSVLLLSFLILLVWLMAAFSCEYVSGCQWFDLANSTKTNRRAELNWRWGCILNRGC